MQAWCYAPLVAVFMSLNVQAMTSVFKKSLVLVLPLVLFLYLVWVVIVGAAPTNLGEPIQPTAQSYVYAVSLKLFAFSALVFSLVEKFASGGAFQFFNNLTIPSGLKALLMLTLSLKNSFSQASTRSFSALVIAGILTPRLSLRNMSHGWLLMRSIWVSTLCISFERLDSKWTIENLPDSCVQNLAKTRTLLSLGDLVWLLVATLPMAAKYLVAGGQ
jgi:hypothetical protein